MIDLAKRYLLALLLAFTIGGLVASPAQSQAVAAETGGDGLVVPPDGGGSAPNCNTVYLTAKKFFNFPAEMGGGLRGVTFKVVGTDLRPWLGTGYGTLQVYITDTYGVEYQGSWGASGQSGALTSTLTGYFKKTPASAPVSQIEVKAFLVKNDTLKCKASMGIYWPDVGPV